jgi:superfamily II DNA/RNA helicase
MSPDPVTFAALGVPDDLVAALSARQISAPFPIQAATIPDALAGRDICGRAPTAPARRWPSPSR